MGYTLIAAFLWGTTFPAIRVGLEWGQAGPFTFAALRFVVAAVLVAGVAVARGRFDLRLLRSPAVIGLAFLNALGYALQFLAQERTSASKTSLLVDINVVAIAILGYFVLGERHGRRTVAAIVLGVLGVALLSTNGHFEAAAFPGPEFVGDVLALASGLVWALYIVGIKALVHRPSAPDGVALTVAVFLWIPLFLVPAALVTEPLNAVGGPAAWTMILYLGLFPSALAFFLWQEALRTESATLTSVVLLLEIVVAVGLSVLFLEERLGGWTLVGALLVMAAALLATQEPTRGASASLPAPAQAPDGSSK